VIDDFCIERGCEAVPPWAAVLAVCDSAAAGSAATGSGNARAPRRCVAWSWFAFMNERQIATKRPAAGLGEFFHASLIYPGSQDTMPARCWTGWPAGQVYSFGMAGTVAAEKGGESSGFATAKLLLAGRGEMDLSTLRSPRSRSDQRVLAGPSSFPKHGAYATPPRFDKRRGRPVQRQCLLSFS